jgi:hypothetical protein
VLYDDLVADFFKKQNCRLIEILWFIDKSFQVSRIIYGNEYFIAFGVIVNSKVTNVRQQIFKGAIK